MTEDAHEPNHQSDLGEIQSVVDTFFAAFATGPDLAERMASLRGLFVPQALVTSTGGRAPAVMDIDAFIEPRRALLGNGTLSEFAEWPTEGRIDVFGDIAHWFGSYAKTWVQDGSVVEGRGMKSIQLVRTAAGWRISAAAWDDERPGVSAAVSRTVGSAD
ncbi:DUF4440 domain-containing protein [Terrabacter sp. 2RAF25]|uniref:DUF4440 domain-containing protein n=1 Tax=Terrabacter sp. 2RAF25 TaxID=3232998 RepID=UPI003F944963